MKKLLWSIMILTITGIYSCNNEIESPEPEIEPNATGYYVYKERDPNSPLILSQRTPRAQTRAMLTFDELLGHSFKVDYYPFETMQNVGYPVVDMKKLNEENPSWTRALPIRQSTTKAFAYSDYDQYEHNSEIKKKVESGFELNFTFFKIGKKKTVEETFTQTLLNTSKSVMGQLDVEIRDALYELHTNSNRMNEIKANYIDKDFRSDLYNMPIDELIKDYGPFVLKNFLTGGRATALYAGVHRSTTSSDVRVEDMTKSINASFSAKKDSISGSYDFGIGRGFTNGTEATTSFGQMEVSIKTVGGAYGYPTFTPSLSLDGFSVDLSAWASSLNSDNTHTVIDIQEEGLIPLNSFFLEENFKQQFENYLWNNGLPLKVLKEPMLICAVILDVFYNCNAAYILYTRYGDLVGIGGKSYGMIKDDYKRKHEEAILDAKNDIERFSNIYKIKTGYNDDFQKIFDLVEINSFVDLTSDISVFKEDSMVKYMDSSNGMLYLLYNFPGNKTGYSIYVGKGDYLLDTYGIREWVETLPETSLSYAELIKYTLIGL